MADDVTLPATAVVATDEVGGRHFQRVKVNHGADGVALDVSPATPLPVEVLGELIEAVEAMRMAINGLAKSIGYALPNAQGQPIMEVRQATAANLNVALASTTISSGTLTTVSTLTNQAQSGGYAMQDFIPAILHMQADGLRTNIQVT